MTRPNNPAPARGGAVPRKLEIGVLYGFRALMVLAVVNYHIWQQSWLLQRVNLPGLSVDFDFFTRSSYLFVDFSKARANSKLLVISVTGRLVVVPLIFLSLAVALGIRDVSLAALIAVYASPTSVSSFPMAQQMGGNGDLAGGQVVFTTVFSILTVFLWVFVLKSLGCLA